MSNVTNPTVQPNRPHQAGNVLHIPAGVAPTFPQAGDLYMTGPFTPADLSEPGALDGPMHEMD